MKTKPNLSVITINYKTDSLLLKLVKGLKMNPMVEIIVVDNSPQNTLEKSLPKRTDLTYLYSGKNLGFSGGNNLGISKAKGEWLLLLNSDTQVDTKSILKWIGVVEDSQYKASAPMLVGADKKIQNNVGYFDNFQKNPVNYIFARPRFVEASKLTKATEVDLMTGAAMLIHRSILSQVSLDEKNFFMYFEDIDFSLQLYNKDIKVLYTPEVKITHLGGASSDQDTRVKNNNYQLGLKSYLVKNRGYLIYYLNKLFRFLT